MLIAKKYYLFHGLDRKKAGLKRVRIAKKNHSSLLHSSLLAPIEENRDTSHLLWIVKIGDISNFFKKPVGYQP